MAVSVTAERIGARSWYVTATPDVEGSTLYWYVDGVLAEVTVRTWRQFEADGVVDVQVFDDVNAVPADVHPARLLLTWVRVTGAVEYRLERWVTDEWVEVLRASETGEEVLRAWTPVLPDGAEALWRIVPVGENGEDGTAFEVTAFVVRTPDPVDWSVSYDAGTGTATITVAA